MTKKPDKTAENGDPGRDLETGRFVVGNSGGPGRPRGYDLRALAEEEAGREGLDLQLALWKVLRKLLDQAESGNTRASQIILEKLGAPEPSRHLVAGMLDMNTKFKPGSAVAANFQKDIREMLEDPVVQAILRAELTRRTGQQGNCPKFPEGTDLIDWCERLIEIAKDDLAKEGPPQPTGKELRRQVLELFDETEDRDPPEGR